MVFAKDPVGECGHGIKKIEVAKVKDKDKLYEEFINNKQFLVEEEIIQSDELNEINPNVVNSFRVVTLIKDGQAYILNNALRVNQDKANVIGCTNDLYFSFAEDGTIDSNVIDDYGNVYEEHPLTGKKFSEVKVKDVTKIGKTADQIKEIDFLEEYEEGLVEDSEIERIFYCFFENIIKNNANIRHNCFFIFVIF